jgi:hypothetical protein
MDPLTRGQRLLHSPGVPAAFKDEYMLPKIAGPWLTWKQVWSGERLRLDIRPSENRLIRDWMKMGDHILNETILYCFRPAHGALVVLLKFTGNLVNFSHNLDFCNPGSCNRNQIQIMCALGT